MLQEVGNLPTLAYFSPKSCLVVVICSRGCLVVFSDTSSRLSSTSTGTQVPISVLKDSRPKMTLSTGTQVQVLVLNHHCTLNDLEYR